MNTKPSYSITKPSEKHLDGLQTLWAEAFGDTKHFIQLFFDIAYSPNRCLVALVGDDVGGALYWFDCEYQGKKLAYLYAVATAKQYRGMGICHSLMTACHNHLSDCGYAGVLLVPGNEDLYSFYRGLGYEVCSYVREFDCVAKKGTLSLQSLTKEQYAKLRRKFLPENGVIQEGENLDFLQTYARFYVGSNYEGEDASFLLAAYQEGNTLHGVELLGHPTEASHIVHALGYSKGIFRTPGDDLPFAMYHSLDDVPVDLPIYFGFSFD